MWPQKKKTSSSEKDLDGKGSPGLFFLQRPSRPVNMHRLIAPAGTDWQVGISSGSIEGLSLALESFVSCVDYLIVQAYLQDQSTTDRLCLNSLYQAHQRPTYALRR
jgi:hypothetical protein